MKKAGILVASSMAALLIVAGGFGMHLAGYPDRKPRAAPPAEIKLLVERGTSLAEIGRRLAEQKALDHPTWFRLWANEQGLATKIRAGQYTLATGLTPRQILATLVAGAAEENVTVTIPEGKNLLEVAAILDEAGIAGKDDLIRLMRDPATAEKLAVPGKTLEGYLYPDTYKLRAGTPALKVLTMLVRRTQAVMAELRSKYPTELERLAKQHKFGDREIVLMASLVEKETARPEERPRIAGVFYNRLRLPTFVPHLLQTDPTIVYGCTVPIEKSAACGKFEGRIRRIHLDDKDNAYSTYAHEGLPPGPISNPGRDALIAAIKPDPTPYLYFVSKNDGSHYFSKTVAEHEAAVDKYQRNK